MVPGPSREGGLERGCVSVAVTLRDTATPTQTKWGINAPLSLSEPLQIVPLAELTKKPEATGAGPCSDGVQASAEGRMEKHGQWT